MLRIHEGGRNDLLAACWLIAVAGAVAYSNTLHCPFVYDGRVMERELAPLSWDPTSWFEPRPRTFGYFTFELQQTLHGRWLPGFHIANIAIHVAAGMFLFGTTFLTCRHPRRPAAIQADAGVIALAASLLFVLHPLQTQSVTYLFQRFESLMGMLFLAAMFCFAMATREPTPLRQERTAWLIGTWVCVLLSIASKEVGVAAPLVLLWYDRVFVADSWQSLKSQRWWFYTFFLAVMALGSLFLYACRDHYAAGGIFNTERMSPLTYAMNQPTVIIRYLGLVVWPARLCLDWALPPVNVPARLLPATIALLGILGFTAWSAVRMPSVGFLLGSFFLILAPTSSFAPIVDLAFEHRMYLPLAALSVLAVLAARACFLWLHIGARTVMVIVAGVALVLAATTYLRNEAYASGFTIWADVIDKAPHNARAYFNLAWHFEDDAKDYPTAIRLYQRSLQLNPRLASSHRSLAALLFPIDRDLAISHARTAVRLERTAMNLSNLGVVLAEGKPVEAEACFREALELEPEMREAKLNLARLQALRLRSKEPESAASAQPLP